MPKNNSKNAYLKPRGKVWKNNNKTQNNKGKTNKKNWNQGPPSGNTNSVMSVARVGILLDFADFGNVRHHLRLTLPKNHLWQ